MKKNEQDDEQNNNSHIRWLVYQCCKVFSIAVKFFQVINDLTSPFFFCDIETRFAVITMTRIFILCIFFPLSIFPFQKSIVSLSISVFLCLCFWQFALLHYFQFVILVKIYRIRCFGLRSFFIPTQKFEGRKYISVVLHSSVDYGTGNKF